MSQNDDKFPFEVNTLGVEDVELLFPGGRLLLCAHGARALGNMLLDAAKKQYCDGYRHGTDATMFLGAEVEGKDSGAVALGRRGGAKGGVARAAKLSPQRRKEIAQKAAQARWKGKAKKASK